MYRSTARDERASDAIPPVRRRKRLAAVGVTVSALALAGAGFFAAGSASAASSETVSDASLTWAINKTASAGAYFGGCNFLSAGTAGDNGSSKVWTRTAPAPGFAGQAGNVTIRKPDASGNYSQPTWANKCTGPDGTTNLTTTTSSASEVQFATGTGTVDPVAGTASISWTGSFTSVFYGGLVYWSAANPTLTVAADGTGTLSASLSGYAASMSDPTQWSPIAAKTVTLATLHGVQVSASGITVTPDYAGVAVDAGSGGSAQVRSGDYWGSFPQDFIDFQAQTGESSYWYSSGLNDQDKVAAPITVSFTADQPTQTAPQITTQPTDATGTVNGTATFTAAASGDPAPTVQWQLQAPGSSTWQNYPGATSPTFALTIHAQGYDGSKVRAVFTNAAGSATTEAVTLHVTSTPPPGGDSETITATVPQQTPAGSFSLTVPANASVTMTEAANQGSYLQSTGSLAPVTVTDTRTGGPQWSVAGQVGDFNGGALSGKYLGWAPQVQTAGAGAGAGGAVTSGITSGNGLTDASTLASATAGHDTGSATLGAGLTLQVPADTPAGTYSSTLTLTALS